MKKLLFLSLLFPLHLLAQENEENVDAQKIRSKNISIIRDKFGVPHIYANTDADAVYGLMYAQCEDNFAEIEMNYIRFLGRMSEVKGSSEIYNDLKMRLLLDSSEAMADYKKCSPYMKGLLDAFAEAVNYYLLTHPETTPVLLNTFEPWYPLMWTNGSIDPLNTAGIGTEQVEQFYSTDKNKSTGSIFKMNPTDEGTGSNSFAIAPALTENGAALLYINPHVSLHYRTEAQVYSKEGLNAYGAITWGQFFVYQGFNEKCGWMHTSSKADAADLYLEKVTQSGKNPTYLYNGAPRNFTKKKITINYVENGEMMEKTFTGYYSHHGPVLASSGNNWITLKSVNRSLNALMQSWEMTKAKNMTEFTKALNRATDNSDNITYADVDGNIAYWHGNFIPMRDRKYDWSKPVDGSILATEWKGTHSLDQLVRVSNPSTGFIMNCNSSPFNVSGSASPKKSQYPAYMAPDGENFRSLNASRYIENVKKFNLEKLINLGYDRSLPAFEIMIPAFINAFEKSGGAIDSIDYYLSGPVEVLRNWDFKVSNESVATALAVEWGEKLEPLINRINETDQVKRTLQFLSEVKSQDLVIPMIEVVKSFNERFYRWEMQWGELNRLQRLSPSYPEHNDANQSTAVPFVASTWGMLPAFKSRYFPGTSFRYGVHGNSFVCAVEFGKKIRAKSILDGGVSADANSPHFLDQAEMYGSGSFKEVLFYEEDVRKNAERIYSPGY